MYSITARVISTLYGGNLGCDPLLSKKETASKIFQFEQEIDEWINALPDCLLLISSSSLSLDNPEDPLWTKFRIILSLRYLNLQVLVYRPVFNRAIDGSLEDHDHTKSMRSMNHMEKNHIQSCFSSAKEIIDIVDTVITSQTLGRPFLGAWWFSLYYGRRRTSVYFDFEARTDDNYVVFNAALMIFGSLLVRPRHSDDPDRSNQIRECRVILERAVQALRKLDEGNATVQRCAKFLEQMSDRLGSHRGSLLGYAEDSNKSWAEISNLERGADGAPMVRFIPDPHQLEQNNGISQTLHRQAPGATDFMLDGMYGDELELGQFFVDGVMEAWIDGQG